MKKKKTPQRTKELKRKACVKKAKEINKQRNDYKCQYCGIGKPQRQIHSHHIFSEGLHKAMSADVDNLIALCSVHHQALMGRSSGGFSFHGSPAEAMIWFKKKYPDLWETLKKRSWKQPTCTLQYWQAKFDSLTKQI